MEKRINQGKQTEYVKRSLINYISDHGLQFGERIPTQFELRQRLGGGNAVISRAIQALIEDGILENRGRNGVVVHNPHVEGYEGRNIGLVCHRDLEFTSMATQMQAIGIELNKHACQMTLFIKSNQESKDVFELCEFRGAQRAILQHKIDGLISTVLLSNDSVAFCRQNKVPLCYVGISKPNAPGVIHNLNIPKLLKNVKERGFTRPLLVHMGHPDTEQLKEDFLSKSKWFDFAPLRATDYCFFIREDGSDAWDSDTNMLLALKLAEQISQMTTNTRPDALIIPDDELAIWMWPVFVKYNWQPELFHLEIKQMAYSRTLRKVGPFQLFDTMKVAELTANLILGMLRDNSCDGSTIEYTPPLCEKELLHL